jgi:HEAT repeat protein
MLRTLTASLCFTLLLLGGCGSDGGGGSGQKREPVYTDKTPEEWLELIQHPRSVGARNRALDAIISYQKDGKDMVSELTKLVGTAKGDARLSVVRCLGEMRKTAAPAIPALAEALLDKTFRHRDGAAKSIGMIGADAEHAVPALVKALTDSDPRVRGEATAALGAYRDHADKILPEMMALLEDDDPNVVALACDGLAGLGSKAAQAVPALQKLKGSSEFIVQQAAEEALRKIRGR